MRCPKCDSIHTRVTCLNRTHEETTGEVWRFKRCLFCGKRFKTCETIIPYLKSSFYDEVPTINPDSNMGRYFKKQRDAASKLARSQQNARPTGCS